MEIKKEKKSEPSTFMLIKVFSEQLSPNMTNKNA